MDAKWVRQCDDGWVDLLVGKDFNKEPYSTDIFLNPSYPVGNEAFQVISG